VGRKEPGVGGSNFGKRKIQEGTTHPTSREKKKRMGKEILKKPQTETGKNPWAQIIEK